MTEFSQLQALKHDIDRDLDKIIRHSFQAGLNKGITALEKAHTWLAPQVPPPDGWEDWCSVVSKWIEHEIAALKKEDY